MAVAPGQGRSPAALPSLPLRSAHASSCMAQIPGTAACNRMLTAHFMSFCKILPERKGIERHAAATGLAGCPARW